MLIFETHSDNKARQLLDDKKYEEVNPKKIH